MAPDLPYPALVANHGGTWIAGASGGSEAVSARDAVRRAADTPMLILNAAVTASRLGLPEISGLDLLELFAFVHPAKFAVPTAGGLAAALGLPIPGGQGDEAKFLRVAAAKMLDTLGDPAWPERHGAWGLLQSLARLRWSWGGEVGRLLKQPERPERTVFTTLPKWEDAAPRARPRDIALPDGAVDGALDKLLGLGSERRTGQRDYARAVAHAFRPRSMATAPNVALAEAGTGIGKTLGYLAPAALWASEAGGTVWLSTYTKALQRQLDHEAGRAYPDAAAKRAKVVVRKGRENYLCLLNLEDAVQGGFNGRAGIFAQLAARWAEYSRDGDMVGGDLPGWLATLFGRAAFSGLTDRRGECIYAGCPHYRTCFIERSTRASAQADLVIANHALVMINAVRGRDDPVRDLVAAGIDRGRRDVRGEEPEQRPKRVLHHQRMAQAAAGGGERHRQADERLRADEVEHVLEQAGIGALVDRRSHDERVGPLDRRDERFRRLREVFAGERAEARPGVDQVDHGQVDAAVAAEFRGDRLDEGAGARGPVDARRERDDAGQGHGWNLGTRRSAPARGGRRRDRSVVTGPATLGNHRGARLRRRVGARPSARPDAREGTRGHGAGPSRRWSGPAEHRIGGRGRRPLQVPRPGAIPTTRGCRTAARCSPVVVQTAAGGIVAPSVVLERKA